MIGQIFNVQKFSIHDGPGIRTTVFFKGCPLRCLWCHNPESKKSSSQILYDADQCLHCGACASTCGEGRHRIGAEGHVYEREGCTGCLACTEACPCGALEAVGKPMSVDEVLAEVMRDEVFYQSSGGGLTLSGGEPMAQAEFCRALLAAAKERGLHTCMETCGYAPWEEFQRLLPTVDLFLYDYKLTDPVLHKHYTGVDNALILENLKRLDGAGAATVLRCPIIPGINDTEEHFAGIARTANALKNLKEVHVEPYHPMGGGKAKRLGVEDPCEGMDFPSRKSVEAWVAALARRICVEVKRP